MIINDTHYLDKNTSISYTFYNCGEPVVVFLYGGMGEINKATWDQIINKLTKNISYLVFDRPGIGLSKPSSLPRTASNFAAEFKSLIDSLGIKNIILVGHSIGGLYARYFASKYSEYISSLILLDATHENQFERNSKFININELEKSYEMANKNPEGMKIPEDPNKSFEQMRQFSKIPDSFHSIIIAAENSLPSVMPNSSEINKINIELQQNLSNKSVNSEFLIAKNCSHFIYIDNPEIVIESIQKVISNR